MADDANEAYPPGSADGRGSPLAERASARRAAGPGSGPYAPSEQILLEVLQAAPDLVATTDAADGLVWINPAGRDLLGIDQGRPVTEIDLEGCYTYASLSHLLETIEPALEAEGSWRGRTMIQAMDGEEIPVEATFVAHRGAEGEVTHHTAIMRDLRDHEPTRGRLTPILEAASDLMATGKPDGTLLSLNQAGRRLIGLEEDEPLPVEWTTFLPEDTIREEVAPQAQELGHWTGELHLQALDGERIPVLATVIQHREPGDDATRYTSMVAHDLRARQAARGAMGTFWKVSAQLLAIASPDGRFLDLNPAWEEVLGWRRSDLTAKPFLAFVHPEDREETRAAMDRLRSGETVRGFENRYETGDGGYRWLRWTSTLDEETGVIYATAEEVTDHRAAEMERRRHRERLAKLVEVQQQLTTSVLDLDESAARLAEVAQQLTGADGALIELAEDGVMVDQAASGIAQEHMGLRLGIDTSLSGTCYESRELIACPDVAEDPRVDTETADRLGIGSMVLVPLVDQEACHGVLKVLASRPHAFDAEDVEMLQLASGLLSTALARSLAFRSLEASEERFRQLAETLDTVLWINRPDFSEVLYVNPAYERIWGRPGSEHDEDPVAWLDAVHVEDIAELVAQLEAWDPDEEPLALAFRIERPDGEIRHIEAEGFPVHGPDGGVSKVVGLAKDVTDVKARQDQAVEQARLQARAEELEQLLHIASHQLRTPIRQIHSFSQILEDTLEGHPTDEQEELLGFIQQGAQNLRSMVKDLATYAEITAHRAPVRPTSAETALDRALDDLEARIEATDATIHRDKLPEVDANPWQLRHLFRELVKNALVFTDGEPVVHVAAEPAGEDRWRFTIEDHGIGFEPQHTERVTRMFDRLHPPGEYEGVGMGLAICRRIVERHGGQLEIEAAPGAGATVRFTLPAAGPGHEDIDDGN